MMAVDDEHLTDEPSQRARDLAARLADVMLPELSGEDIQDIYQAVTFICMQVLTGCAGGDKENLLRLYGGASTYFAELAGQERHA